MCGICGTLRFSAAEGDRRLLGRMCQALVHRGPDAEGIYTAPHIGLGQRRLSIIDLSAAAVAPLGNEDGSMWVTFNGEIYNFRQLRADLERRGHAFRTGTDGEVIVHLYEEYGVECLSRMRGMFAFALWDSRERRLFAARDRLGKKPFYYAETAGGLTFASEIQAILTDPEVSVAPNYRAIDEYLTWHYVPSPLTAFDGISKIPAGHFLVAGVDGSLKVEQYWRPTVPEKIRASEPEIADELLRRLREAVRMRLVSDVPLGAFLSGGIDSSVVVALMAEASHRPVKTFSIGFEEGAFNELPYARQIADRCGTDHHEFIVRPSASEVLPELVRHYGEPFGDSSALPTYYVSRLTRQHVTVALSGDGGDESFGGYDNYGTVVAWARGEVLPAPVRGAGLFLARALQRLPYQDTIERVSRGLEMLGARPLDRYRLQSSILKPAEKRAAYTREFWALIERGGASTSDRNGPAWDETTDVLDWMMCRDLQTYLPDCLMVKVDVASMAHGLEVRCPLLDHELVEFAAAIPSAMKRDASGAKLVLKHAMRTLLPATILARGKTGFGIPLAKWLRTDLAEGLRGALLDDRARRRNLFAPRFVAHMVDSHMAGRRDWSSRLWAMLWLELWFREFID